MRCPKVVSLLLLVVCGLASLFSCSEWDTDSLGSKFVPANSQVRAFTHQVFVEYSAEEARVWGPSVHEVTATVDGLNVSLENASDSLALFVYGYTAPSDATLRIRSSLPYALYLNGLSLHTDHGPALRCEGPAPCYIVAPIKSRNQLYGSVEVEGPLYLTGRGSIAISSRATALTAASLQCQYGLTIDIDSQEGDGIRLDGPMRSTMGTWTINAAGNGIVSPDSIVLLGGTYQGVAADGSFLEAGNGVMVRCPKLTAAAGWNSNVVDSALVALRYDSVQYVWQASIDTLTIEADSTYQIYQNRAKTPFASLRAARTIAQPWFLICNSAITSVDTLHFILGKKK